MMDLPSFHYRVAELEGLLASIRAKEFRTGLDVQKSGGQLGALVERNRLLQEQVATLQQQVIALQQSRDVQDRELSRLRSETLLLAKQTAAAAAGGGSASGGRDEKGRGGKGGGRNGEAAAEGLKGALADQVRTERPMEYHLMHMCSPVRRVPLSSLHIIK
jgi:hypothetical protein